MKTAMKSKTFIDVQKLKIIVVHLRSIGMLMTLMLQKNLATLLYQQTGLVDSKGVSYN